MLDDPFDIGQNDGNNPNKHHMVKNPPNDTVSSIAWSPKRDMLASTSWDNTVRVWSVQFSNNGGVRSKAVSGMRHKLPALCCCWNSSGGVVFSAGCTNMAMAWDLRQNKKTTVAKHDAPIRKILGLSTQ